MRLFRTNLYAQDEPAPSSAHLQSRTNRSLWPFAFTEAFPKSDKWQNERLSRARHSLTTTGPLYLKIPEIASVFTQAIKGGGVNDYSMHA